MIAQIFLAAARPAASRRRSARRRSRLNFDQAAYITCREAHAMHARGAQGAGDLSSPSMPRATAASPFPTATSGAQLAYLVRGGCTLSPDAYLFTVIDRAIVAEMQQAAQAAVTFLMFLSPLGERPGEAGEPEPAATALTQPLPQGPSRVKTTSASP